MCSNVDDLNNRNLFMTAKLLKQGYRYHKIRKAFFRFYHRHSELIVRYNIGLKTLLQQGISEPIFSKELLKKYISSDQFKKIIKLYKKKLDITWMSCNSLQAWLYTQSLFIARVSSLIGRWWVRPQIQGRLCHKALIIRLVPDAWL